jgi:hypothetical protein
MAVVVLGGNTLRAALAERGWSYTRTISELRKLAKLADRRIGSDASMVTMLSRWVCNHVQPDDFYRGLLADALRKPRVDLFPDEARPSSVLLDPFAMLAELEDARESDMQRRHFIGSLAGLAGAAALEGTAAEEPTEMWDRLRYALRRAPGPRLRDAHPSGGQHGRLLHLGGADPGPPPA